MQALCMAVLVRGGACPTLTVGLVGGLHQPQQPVAQLISLRVFGRRLRTAAACEGHPLRSCAAQPATERRPVAEAHAALLQCELHAPASEAVLATEGEGHQERQDREFMAAALEEARKGAAAGEVPVGAVLVFRDEIIARAHNSTMRTGDPIAHAEILCIQQAAKRLTSWRLLDAALYSTLEPCAMCAGAMLQSRVGTLVYGARNNLSGADGSWVDLLPMSPQRRGLQPCSRRPHPFHPDMEVRRGVLGEESSALLREFFRWRRQQPSFSEEQVVPLHTQDDDDSSVQQCGHAVA